MVGREFVRLVAREQRFAPPNAEMWAQAKERYITLITGLHPRALSQMTWSEAGQAGRVVLELSALYYIGTLAGQAAGFPIAFLRRKLSS